MTTPTQPPETAPDQPEQPDPRIQRANAEAARYRVERNDVRERLAAREAEHASRLEALQAELAAAQATATQAQQHTLRLEAAAAHGLPTELAERLQGADADALHADAQRLAALLPVQSNTRTGKSSSPPPSRAQQIFQRIGGGDQNAFDVLLQQRIGGGTLNADES